ncbi:MAG: tetratricopeptide repeat protein [Myxococcales bacterium]|nr:tetratricopeptide repeat protein [Myxococcales bacterium]
MQTSDPFSFRGVRSSLVGRDEELSQMKEAVASSAEARRPQLVTVVGNQGTGKSRLVDELLNGLPNQTLFYRCAAARNGARYSTIARLLRARFAISETASEGALIDEFRREVQEVFGDQRVAEYLHVLGGFLDIQFPDSPFLRVLAENPKQYEEVARTVLRHFVEVDGSHGPIVLVVDDLQWADEGSLSLLQELSTTLHTSPVTLLVCARPELMVRMAEWGAGVSEHLRVELRNLDAGHAEAMFRSMLGRCDFVPEEIVEDAVEMTGGNAYFLDQLVRLFLANGTVNADVTPWEIDADMALEADLPITVEEAIEARIASLAVGERAVLEKGAVFGNVFWIGSVVALSRIERALANEEPPPPSPAGPLDYNWSNAGEDVRRGVTACIEELVERDYLLRLDAEDSTVAGDVELVFKHNLERELVAKSTERRKLSRYHRLAAQWIETKSSARSEEQLEFLGQLYERGGDRRRAAHSYIAGGDRARARYANEQAVELYRKGLEFLEEDDAVVLLDALHSLGSVLDLIGETGEAQRHFSRMLRNAWLFDHRSKGGAAHNRLGRIHRRLGECDQAMAHLRSAHELFKASEDKRGIAGTLDDIGQVHWLRGRYGQALEFHRQALAIRRAVGDPRSIALSLANIGRVHRETGAFQAASLQFHEALGLRREIGDTAGVIQSLCDLAGLHSADGEPEEGMKMFAEARESATAIGDKLALTQVLSGLGQCQAESGQFSDAIESLLEGKAIARQFGNLSGAAECYRHLAETYLRIGDGAQALDNAKRSLELGERIGSRSHVGSAHRLMAESTFRVGRAPEDLQASEGHFQNAVEILAGMKHELELARTYRSYAVHREHAGNVEEAEKLRRRSDEIFGRLRGAARPDEGPP